MKKSYKSQLRRLLVFALAIALIGSLGMPVMAHAQTNEISSFSYEIEDGVAEELTGESAAEPVYDPPEEPADEPVYEEAQEEITPLGSGSNLTAPTLDVSSASGRPGDIISVTVSLQDNPGVSGFWLTMQYPEESLEFIEAVPGDIVSRYFSVFTGTPNRISIRAVAPAPPENVEIEGELFTIYFRILWGTLEGRIDGVSIGYHRELDTIAHSFEHLPRATNQEVDITVTALGTYNVTYEFTGTVPAGAAALLPTAQNNVDPGTPMTRASAPTLTGYTFSGWTTASDITLDGDNFYMPDNDVLFTGYWTSDSHGGIDSWVALREAVDAAPANVPTTIEISNSFTAPARPRGDEIVIPADRDITLVSTNTALGEDNVRTLTQPNNRALFAVDGSLTLGQNITLSDSFVSVLAGGTLTMNEGSVIENSTGGGLALFGSGTAEATRATFYMNGGMIRNNTRWSGGGVLLSTNSRMYMSGGYIIGNTAIDRGGGIEIASATAFMYMSGGAITGNTATGGSDGIGRGGGVVVTSAQPNAFTMTGGSITNNTAYYDGGGIHSSNANHSIVVPETAYRGLNIGEAAIFYGNTAGNGASAPPDNRLPHIAVTLTSIWNYALNNYDINYTGRLGEEPIIVGHSVTYEFTGTVPAGAAALLPAAQNNVAPGTPMTRASAPTLTGYIFSGWTTAADITLVGDNFYMPDNDVLFTGYWTSDSYGGIDFWVALREAVDAAPANVPTTIAIGNSFGAPISPFGDSIVIPADRDITLVSTNTAPGDDNVRTLTQTNSGQQHFTVYGSLTLKQNITLSGGSGSVFVLDGGTLTMNDGSVIENSTNGGVLLSGSSTTESTFYMNGGTIRNNSRMSGGGGVVVASNSRMYMSGGYIIGNTATTNNGGGGIMIMSSTAFVYMSGGTITGNAATGATGTGGVGGGVSLSMTAPDAFTMTGGSITNNTAYHDGGGIYTRWASHSLTVHATAYRDLNIGEAAIFYGNTAGNGASAPPDNRLPHIAATSASIWDYVLNNYDINYRGRLGETPIVVGHSVTYQFTGTVPTGAAALLPAAQNNVAPGTPMTLAPAPTLAGYTFSGWTTTTDVTLDGDNFNMPDDDVVFTGYWIVEGNNNVVVDSWVALRAAVNAAPANVPTTIEISHSFEATEGVWNSDTIVIPAARDITLVSTNTEPGENNVRTLTFLSPGRRHFFVDGSLTLGQNITLRGLADSNIQTGGVIVRSSDAVFTMNEGSVIENCLSFMGAVSVSNGTFYMNGGIIRNNFAQIGGGVAVLSNGRMNMSGGYITGNTATTNSGGGGIAFHGLGATGNIVISGGAITGNTAPYGGGISVEHPNRANILTITGGSITNNTATGDGGGIFTQGAHHNLVLGSGAFFDLYIGEDVIFYGNTADNGASAPPDNRLPHIATTSASIWDYVLNNYDINYKGRLGETPIIVGHSVTYEFTGTVPAVQPGYCLLRKTM